MGGGAGQITVQDPVILTATNLNDGTVVEHTLVDIDMSHEGIGHVDILGPLLHVDIPNFEIDLVIDPAVIDPAQAGRLSLQVTQGVLTGATATGIYAGSTPPIGTQVPFDVPMPQIVLDYDLGLDPNQPWGVVATMGGGGGAMAGSAAACPPDLAEPLGVLDLADINAFILGFVEMLPQGDLSGDGLLDLEDIGLFVESFTSGCP